MPPLPLLPAVMVRRHALLKQLDDSHATVVSLTAPGGFGKSTLLGQWLDGSPRRVIWLQIPAGSDSVEIAERISMEFSGPRPRPVVTLPVVHDDAQWFSVVLPALQELIAAADEPFVLVLDDAMHLADSQADGLVNAVVTALPEHSQLVVATRGATPRTLRRLRVTGRVLELRAADLAMDDDEARLLLDELSVHLPQDQLALMVERTEGWPVGLYLLGRAVLSEPELLAADEVPNLTTEWVADFIRDELFDGLDHDSKTLLMRVSVLDELAAVPCDAAAGSTGTLARLRQLSTENQLISVVPGDADTYRLHALFRSFLQKELREVSPADFEACHADAARWYASDGQLDLAVRHLREGGDDHALADFVWSQAWRLLATGQWARLARWLSNLSEDRLLAHPGLCLSAAWLRTQEGDMSQVVHYARRARSLASGPSGSDEYQGHSAIIEATIGGDGLLYVGDLCDSALELLDNSDPWRCLAHYLRGVVHLNFGRIDDGMTDLEEGCRLARRHGVMSMTALCLAAQATVRLALGHVKAAEALIGEARSLVFENKLEHLPTAAPIFTASALVLLAADHRPAAQEDAARALRLTALLEPIAPWHAVEGRLRLGQTYWQLGDHRRARTLTDEARAGYVPAARSPLLDQMLEAAERLVADVDISFGSSPLTTAELRVLQYLPSHLTFPEIGQRLFLSRHTVKSQALSIYRKLGVNSRSGAVACAWELGLLPQG